MPRRSYSPPRAGGVERDGRSGQLSFTYTNAKIRYTISTRTANDVITSINSQVNSAQFNKLTAAHGGSLATSS